MTLRYRLWNKDLGEWEAYANGVPRSMSTRSRAVNKRKAMKNFRSIIIKPVDEFGKVVYIEAKKRKGGVRPIVPVVREVETTGGGEGTFAIEEVGVTPRNRTPYGKFLSTLVKLEIGESFLYPVTSNHRNILAACPILTGRRYSARAEGNTYRVGRVA